MLTNVDIAGTPRLTRLAPKRGLERPRGRADTPNGKTLFPPTVTLSILRNTGRGFFSKLEVSNEFGVRVVLPFDYQKGVSATVKQSCFRLPAWGLFPERGFRRPCVRRFVRFRGSGTVLA
jgi:hypothetical protein